MNRPNPARLPAARQIPDGFRKGQWPPSAMPPVAMADHRAGGAKPAIVDQRSPAGWSVTRDALAGQIERRLNGVDLPNQASTSYCGVASFLYCVLQDRPDLYVAYAVSLWTGNHFTFRSQRGGIDIGPTSGTIAALGTIQKRRNPRISDLDWMTMAGLSSATHGHNWNASADDGWLSELKSVTWPSMVMRWFASVGAALTMDTVGSGVFGSTMDDDLNDLLGLLSLWSTHWLVFEIDASLLEGGSPGALNRHWVVVDPYHLPHIRLNGGRGAVVQPGDLRGTLRKQLFGPGPSPTNVYAAMGDLKSRNAELAQAKTGPCVRELGRSTVPNAANDARARHGQVLRRLCVSALS